MDYNLTYAPVAKWQTIRLCMVLSIINGWQTVQIDYVLAFPQAPIEKEMYMKMPNGLKQTKGKDEYVLKVKRNVYGEMLQHLIQTYTAIFHSRVKEIEHLQIYMNQALHLRLVLWVLH